MKKKKKQSHFYMQKSSTMDEFAEKSLYSYPSISPWPSVSERIRTNSPFAFIDILHFTYPFVPPVGSFGFVNIAHLW